MFFSGFFYSTKHTEVQQATTRLSAETGTPIKLPSYDQVRREIHRLGSSQIWWCARTGKIAPWRMRVTPIVCALHSRSGPDHPGR